MADDVAPGWDRSLPFPPGNLFSLQHGAHSPRVTGPLAVQIEQDARAESTWPGYLNDPTYTAAVAAWAHAEAVALLLRRYVADRSLDDVMDDVETSETDEETTAWEGGSRTRRVSSARRTRSAFDRLDRAERLAASHRARLGLDPVSRARLGRDVTAARVDLASMLSDAAERAAERWPDAGRDGGTP